jgi:hypothetical protein
MITAITFAVASAVGIAFVIYDYRSFSDKKEEDISDMFEV